MSIKYDSLRAWIDEFELRRENGHELGWSDSPKEALFGFWDLDDDTHHEIPVSVAFAGFSEIPFMESILRPVYPDSYWSIPVPERPPSARVRALKEGLRSVV